MDSLLSQVSGRWEVAASIGLIGIAYLGWKRLSAAPKIQVIAQGKPLPVPGKGIQFKEVNWLDFRPRGLKLATYRSVPEGKPKGIVFVFNGWNEHSGRNAHVADAYARQGYISFGLDYVGFGKSEGLSGHIANFNHLVEDSLEYIHKVREMHPELPAFLFGQSLGGTMCVSLALKKPEIFQGMVVIAPAVKPQEGFYPILRTIVSVIGSWIPKLPILQLESGISSKNPNVTQDFLDDALCFHGRTTVGTIYSIIEITSHLGENLHRVNVPFLVLHGSIDKLVHENSSKELYEKAAAKDKTFKFIEGGWHDLLHEPEHEQVFQEFIAWTNQRALR